MKQRSLARYLPWFVIYAIACPMGISVTPAIIQGLGVPDYMFGVSTATMSALAMLMTPLWGRLSDTHGRARILILTLLGACFGQLLFSRASSGPTLILARATTGFFAGGHSLNTLAYFAALSTQQRKERNLALHVALGGVCSAVGLWLGGALGNISIPLTFHCQIAMLLACAIALPFVVKEPLRSRRAASTDAADPVRPRPTWAALKPVLTLPLALAILLGLISTMGYASFDDAFSYYLTKDLKFSPAQLGYVRAGNGMLALAAYFLITLRLMRGRDALKPTAALLLICTLCLALAFLANGGAAAFVLIGLAFLLVNSVFVSLLQAGVVSRAGDASMGLVAGLFLAFKSGGSVLGSLGSGFSYSLSPRLPFALAACAFLTATLLAATVLKLDRRPR